MKNREDDYFSTIKKDLDCDKSLFSPFSKLRKKGGYKVEAFEGCPYYGDEEMMLRKCKNCIDMNCF